jgi:hypothetical protein
MKLYSVAVILIILFLVLCYNTGVFWRIGSGEGFVDSGRCGPNLGVCPAPLRCMNGYCGSDVPPKLPKYSELPVVPPRYVNELTPEQQYNMQLI